MKVLPQLIGSIHLLPLAGTPRACGHPHETLQKAGKQAIQEAKYLTQLGFEGIILENRGDVPFYKNQVPPEVVSSLAIIAAAVREVVSVPIGIHVLRNDAKAALAIAAVTGCDFIRVQVLMGVVATDQGLIEGQAVELLKEKQRLGLELPILADVHVQHAVTLSSLDIGLAIEELVERGLADGVILTSKSSAHEFKKNVLVHAAQTAKNKNTPLYLEDGFKSNDYFLEVYPWVHGVILSSQLRKNAQPGASLETRRAQQWVYQWKSVIKKRK